jgi:predicted nucleotidyltransferase
MRSLSGASLTAQERRVIERLLAGVETELGPDLRAVWLYGSRARGEPPGDDSDVDVIVVSERSGPDEHLRLIQLALEAALEEGANPMAFSIKLYDPEFVAERRRIRSFFIHEVDRDKLVLAGQP